MFDDLRVRIVVILALIALSAWTLLDRGITLGLDLRGGTQLALEVQDPQGALTAEQRADAVDRALQVIRTRIDELGVAEPNIQRVGQDRIIVELPGASQEEQQRARDVIQQAAFLQFQIVQPATELANALPRIDRAIEGAGVTVTPAAGDTAGGAAPTGLDLFEAAGDSAAADTAAAAIDTAAAAATQTTSTTQPLSSLLAPGGTGPEAVFIVANEDVPLVEQYLALPQVRQFVPRGAEFLWGLDQAAEAAGYRTLYLVNEEPLITGEFLVDAQAQRDPVLNQPIVVFEFNRRGGRVFERGTTQNVGNLMAIVLDDRVFSAPVIRSAISTRGQIEMAGSTIEEASDLALVLRAGALPAPIQIVEERSVGPSLGQDSIDQGIVAGIIGLGLVIVIMIGYYKFSGVMSIVALTLYALFVIAGLSAIGARLTLPGIAGLILSIGMAVDANVLIFERIREELALGRSVRMAINEGFANALSAIVDAQLTTLITAFVLYQFGTGPVRGFAVTLTLGIVASMFTAIFVTRTLFMLYLDRRPGAETVSI